MGLFQNCGNDRDPLGTRLAKRGLVLRGARGGGAATRARKIERDGAKRRAAQKEKVEAGGAEELAVGVQPHVVGEQVAVGVLFVRHGAELDELENLFVKARARLRKEGVAMHLDGTEDGEHEQQRAQGENRGQRAAEVQDSFKAAGIHLHRPRG